MTTKTIIWGVVILVVAIIAWRIYKIKTTSAAATV